MIPLTLLALGCAEPPTHDTLPQATTLAEQGVEAWPAESLYFSWIQTVWAYGVLRLHAASEEEGWLQYDQDWLLDELPRFQGEDPKTFDASDSMSPALVASAIMVQTGEDDFTPITDAAWLYLDEVAGHTQAGAITHWSDQTTLGPPDQVWVDSQFMVGLFLLQEHARTGDAAALDQFATQYQLFSDHCRDPDDQLYRHAWDDVEQVHIPADDTYWLRGNSWVLVSAAEALAMEGVDEPALSEVLPLFQAHARATVALQASDGLWHTVMNSPHGDDPDNYTETSGSALVAYALARGLQAGALDESEYGPALTRAVHGVQDRLDLQDDGWLRLEGTSHGTNPGDYAYYVSVGQADDLMLGVGAVTMLLAQVHGRSVVQ